jgi:hypothetical protein
VWRGVTPECIRQDICNDSLIIWSIKHTFPSKKKKTRCTCMYLDCTPEWTLHSLRAHFQPWSIRTYNKVK